MPKIKIPAKAVAIESHAGGYRFTVNSGKVVLGFQNVYGSITTSDGTKIASVRVGTSASTGLKKLLEVINSKGL